MTQRELENLVAWAENQERCRAYARGIVEAYREAEKEHRLLNNYDTMPAEEWLQQYADVTKMHTSVMMKIKHFFDLCYGKGNIFCQTLKGKDYIDHWYKFRDFAHKTYCNCDID